MTVPSELFTVKPISNLILEAFIMASHQALLIID
ncbi:isochorismatase, partial [Lactiplantibacillus plantarum]